MPQPETKEIVDPIILAAMVEDPDETEEEKKMREELLGTTDTTPGKGTPSSDDDEDDEEIDDDKGSKKPKSDDKKDDDEEEDQDEDEDDPDKKKSKPTKKPVEAEDDTDDDVDEDLEEDEDKPKKTRKEKRQERNEDFLTSIRKDNARSPDRRQIPNYQALDYNDEEKEFKPEELAKDREMVGAVSFARGAEEVRQAAEQDLFWRDLGYEAKVLAYDPKLNFLADKLPDGKDNPSFDADKAEEINTLYLQLAGFKQYVKVDQNNRPLYDRNGQPVIVNRVARTDLSYEKFARRYVDRMSSWAEDFADERVEETKSNLTKQRKTQGIRPTGGKRKSLGALNPGDISRMSDDELDKNEAAIDAQIDAMLGL